MTISPHVLGKYELREPLGRGGMAEVWKAFDTQLQRYVAVKLLHPNLQADPTFLTRFEQEARAVASLHHPHIVQVYDFHAASPSESETPQAYMVMTHIEGQTLAQALTQRIARQYAFSAPEIVRLMSAISSAVDYAHANGMIHRDLKPANILLDQRTTTHDALGEPFLSDFGIAKMLGTSTVTQTRFGTPTYLSPEQALGAPGNELSDLYSLGIILYELLTGSPPFRGPTPVSILMQHVNTEPTPPTVLNPAVPPAVSQVVLRSLQKDPANRFSSASALTLALAHAFGVPAPDELVQLAQQTGPFGGATYFRPLQSVHTPQQSGEVFSSQPFAHVASAPLPVAQVRTYRRIDIQSSHTPEFQHPVAPVAHSPQRRRLLPALLLLLVLAGTVAGAITLYTQRGASSAQSANATGTDIVGHGYITSSDQIDPTNSQGVNDQLLLELSHIPATPSGMAYYAWLLNDKNVSDAMPFLLGKLLVSQGQVHLSFVDEQHHANILASDSRILLTQEATDVMPMSPTLDQHAWHYYAELPQTPNPQDTMGHSSQLTHLRHLLSQDPWIESLGLNGGLASWMTRNAEKMLEWTVSARDDWGDAGQIPFMRRQFIRTLEYVDGRDMAQKDVPLGTSLLTDPKVVSVGLLGSDLSDKQHPDTFQSWMMNMKDPATAGYLYDVSSHLAAVIWSPGATEAQKKQAWAIDAGLNHMRADYEQVRKDALQLLTMTDVQLQQPTALKLLNDMTNHATNAYSGQYDPTGQWGQPGALNIYHGIQALATFDLRPYKVS